MRIRIYRGLPYVAALLIYQGQALTLDWVVLDTGSARSIFAADKLLLIGIRSELTDRVERVRGVGGSEEVFTRVINSLAVGDLQTSEFEIQVGAMEYGFDIEGIIGLDFLLRTGAIIDLGRLELLPGNPAA